MEDSGLGQNAPWEGKEAGWWGAALALGKAQGKKRGQEVDWGWEVAAEHTAIKLQADARCPHNIRIKSKSKSKSISKSKSKSIKQDISSLDHMHQENYKQETAASFRAAKAAVWRTGRTEQGQSRAEWSKNHRLQNNVTRADWLQDSTMHNPLQTGAHKTTYQQHPGEGLGKEQMGRNWDCRSYVQGPDDNISHG